MSQQLKELLEKIISFYEGNGEPSINMSSLNCHYYMGRGDGKDQRCAIGCILSLEQAKELENLYPYGMDICGIYSDIEEDNFKGSVELKNALTILVNTYGLVKLSAIQNAHDMAASNKEDFITSLKNNLNSSIPGVLENGV